MEKTQIDKATKNEPPDVVKLMRPMNKLFEITPKKNSSFCNKGVPIKLNPNTSHPETKYYTTSKILKPILLQLKLRWYGQMEEEAG